MFRWVAAFCLIGHCFLYSTGWQTAMPIPPGVSSGVNDDVCLVFNAANNTMVATWGSVQGTASTPFYSVFNGVNWSVATSFATIQPLQNVELVYYPKINKVIAAWGGTDHHAYFSIYDGISSWTTSTIDLGLSNGVATDVTLVYDEANNSILAAWADASSHHPYYSIYTGGPTWSTPTNNSIPYGSSSGVFDDVNLAYGNGQIMAAWGDATTVQNGYYNFFNGSNWLTAGEITMDGSSGVHTDVCLAYLANNNTFMAAWVNRGDFLGGTSLYYSLFQEGNWTTGNIPIGDSSGGYQNVNLLYNPNSQTVFAAWQDNENTSSNGYYSIFNGSWSPTAAIPLENPTSDGIDVNILMAYNPSLQEVFAAWGNFHANVREPQNPYYATYLTPPLPPANLTGKRIANDFGVVVEYNNLLEWQASPSPSIDEYWIYRNGVLIAQVKTLKYLDNNVKRCEVYTYSVTAVNGQVQSQPATITIKG